jgi:regulator of protease activity HflC (stomatin/prohibitin superfamily)
MNMSMRDEDDSKFWFRVKVGIVFAVLGIIGGMAGCPYYAVYQQRLEGEAELAKAQYSKQVQIQDAEAKFLAAKSLAQAEIERAHGVAEANKIIGKSLEQNESYLKWLWIEGMKEKENKEIIYIPTEAGIPLLEAGKRGTGK